MLCSLLISVWSNLPQERCRGNPVRCGASRVRAVAGTEGTCTSLSGNLWAVLYPSRILPADRCKQLDWREPSDNITSTSHRDCSCSFAALMCDFSFSFRKTRSTPMCRFESCSKQAEKKALQIIFLLDLWDDVCWTKLKVLSTVGEEKAEITDRMLSQSTEFHIFNVANKADWSGSTHDFISYSASPQYPCSERRFLFTLTWLQRTLKAGRENQLAFGKIEDFFLVFPVCRAW